jgi:UDP-N-acetylmuramyl pentapeptide phosphotransferase/UDP-N-acetylglucosamine-1-phosphate transferase
VSAPHGPQDGESLDTGGAGRGGGLLFVAVLLFVAYLAFEALLGLLRFAVSAVLLALAVMLLLRVLRRR